MREKIIALFLTAIMASMIAVPILAATYALGDYPNPFCVDGDCTNFRIVYGSGAKAEDLAGGSDVLIRLGGESYTLVSTTGGTATTVTGEGARLDTASNRIIPGECMNNAKTTITDTDMPTLLADATVYGDDGTAYGYTQDIQLNADACLYYSRSDNDLTDPELHIEMVPTTGSPTYTTRITFSKTINVSSTDVIDNSITLFGKEWTIGTGSDYNTLILYGGADTQTINEGEEVTVTVGGVEYTVGVGGVSSSTVAVISVNGVSESMSQGSTKKISGLDVYLAAVYYYPKEGQVSQAKISLGSQKVTLENGDEVLVGTNTYIDETVCTVTGTSGTGISQFTVATPAQDSDEDDIQIGGSFLDPVWGSFKLEFSSTTPALDAATNDVITVTGSADTATVKFTDYGGTEKTIQFAYDNNTASGTVTPFLMDSNSYKYIIREGDKILYKHYVVVDKADDTHLLQLTNVPGGEIKTTDTVRFTDVFSDTIYEHTFTSSEIGGVASSVAGCSAGANVTMRLGSQDYYVTVCNATAKSDSYVRLFWDDTNALAADTGAGFNTGAGNYTLFPQLKAKNGEYIIFVTSNYTLLPNASWVILPYQGITKTVINGGGVDNASTHYYEKGKINYTTDTGASVAPELVRVVPEALKNYNVGLMILEEERADNYYYAIYIGITETGTTTKTVKVDTPKFIDSSSVTGDTTATRQPGDAKPEFTTWGSDTYTSEAIDGWGAVVKYYNKDEAQATITYPNTQLYGDIFFLSEGAVTSTSATGTGTVKQSVPITWSVSLVDTDIQDPATVDYNLILVGGSCANSLVQQLVDDGKLDATFTCAGGTPGEGWETGKGYIWLIEDAFKTGQTVLVVAGTEKAQTKTACSVLQKFGTLLKDSTATAISITSATTAGITPL
jgi:hypothetical protein